MEWLGENVRSTPWETSADIDAVLQRTDFRDDSHFFLPAIDVTTAEDVEVLPSFGCVAAVWMSVQYVKSRQRPEYYIRDTNSHNR